MSNFVSGQTLPEKKSVFDLAPELNIIFFKPIQFGNHSLAESHESSFGAGISIYTFEYKNFRIGSGFDFSRYTITDFQKMGNITNSNYTSFYGTICYDLPVNSHIILQPNFGVGSAKLHQKTGRRSFGYQYGTELRFGLVGNYKINKTISGFVGAQYIQTYFRLKTAPEFEKFFGQAQQIQLSIGIKLK